MTAPPPSEPDTSFTAMPGELGRLLAQRRSVRNYSDAAVPLRAVQNILLAGQGITSPDGKRSAPSAHARHPLRVYLLARRVDGLNPALYAYENQNRHAQLQPVGAVLAAGALLAASLANDVWLEEAAVVVVMAADRQKAIDHFADQQADGLRGLRYVDFEAGAAAQNMQLCAAREGLGSVVVMGFNDEKLKTALTLLPQIHPVTLLCVGYPAAAEPEN